MALMTRAEFARLRGVHKGTVTKWGHEGRLVEVDGRVDAEASAARIEATRGARYDVSERWDASRGVAPLAQPGDQAAQPGDLPAAPMGEAADADESPILDTDAIGIRTRHAKMLSAEADARMRERADLLAAGAVVDRAAVRGDLAVAAGLILAAAEPMPDDLTPVLVGVADADKVRAILRDWLDGFLHGAADALARAGEGRR